MPITTSDDILTFTTTLGQCYKVYTDALTSTVLTNAFNKIVEARGELQAFIPDPSNAATVLQQAEYDNFLTLLNAIRTIESGTAAPASPADPYTPAIFQATLNKAAVAGLFDILKNSCVALNNYFLKTYGTKMKEYEFQGTASPSWTSDFRALWRRAMNEELPMRVGVFTNTSAFAADGVTWTLPSTVELRVTGVASVPTNLSFSGTLYKSANGISEVVTATVPDSRTTSTVVALTSQTSPNSFVSLSGTPTLTGRQTGDIVELWIK